jgi:hypothetical protein
MKWEYFGTGLAFIGIGITLVVALPPPWWLKMPPPLVHIGVIVGALLTVVGVIVAVFGLWPILPNPKTPVLGMGLAVFAFCACALWFWIIPETQFSIETKKPLRRLIAYSGLDFIMQWDGKVPQFKGYNVRVDNVSGSDTITSKIMFVRADVDGTSILATGAPGEPVIIPQTQGSTFQIHRSENVPISLDAKTINVEFEVNYDTIPETGIRRSYRKLTYPLNWANGKNSAPLLEPKTIDAWEK